MTRLLARSLTRTALPGLCSLVLLGTASASSHMDAPLITLDVAANTTDVYAFVSRGYDDTGGPDPRKYLTGALAVYPHQEPGIGPNKYNFDDAVLYEMHVALGDDLRAGRPTLTYQFEFRTRYKNVRTILQSYLGVIRDVGDANQNLTQEYTVTRIDRRRNRPPVTVLGSGQLVPPNNQGIATPEYNLDAGNGPARDGVGRAADLDRYTRQTVSSLRDRYFAFAGQRDDGFYADVQAVFDLLQLRGPGQGFDSQGGFNVHTMVLQIPLTELGGDRQVAGVYATTSRRQIQILTEHGDPIRVGPWIQVGRQGNPLFNEGFVALVDKDRYSRTSPSDDQRLFATYAIEPELARLLNAIVFRNNPIPGIERGRTDLAGIFIPDLIKVDLSTQPARLAGSGPGHPTNPDQEGFSRLSIFGGDTLFSALQNGPVPGGWPNGRRFGDDVLDIGVSAVISDLRVNPPVIRIAGDGTDRNDIGYHKVMPYAATPLNGRNHGH